MTIGSSDGMQRTGALGTLCTFALLYLADQGSQVGEWYARQEPGMGYREATHQALHVSLTRIHEWEGGMPDKSQFWLQGVAH